VKEWGKKQKTSPFSKKYSSYDRVSREVTMVPQGVSGKDVIVASRVYLD
jgi:hypothetical protein